MVAKTKLKRIIFILMYRNSLEAPFQFHLKGACLNHSEPVSNIQNVLIDLGIAINHLNMSQLVEEGGGGIVGTPSSHSNSQWCNQCC